MFGINGTISGEILFGVTGGLLSLVGLIAIYISINSQQNIQKAKEYLWELQSYTLLNNDFNERSAKRIRWILQHYTDLNKASKPLKLIIWVATFVLIFCGLSWWAYISPQISGIRNFSFGFLLVAEIFLGAFIIMLYMLTKTTKMGDLPKPQDLLNIKFIAGNSINQKVKVADVDVPELMFANSNIELVYLQPEEKIVTFRLVFPLDVKYDGAKLHLHIVGDSTPEYNKLPEVIDTAVPTKIIDRTNDSIHFVFKNTILPTNDQGSFCDLNIRLELREDWNTLVDSPYLMATFKVPGLDLNKVFQGEKFYPNSVKHSPDSREFAESNPHLIALNSMI